MKNKFMVILVLYLHASGIMANSSLLNAANSYSASTSINSTTPAMAFDGDITTRWESEYDDPQWISIDFQSPYYISSLIINWETAAGKTYEIQLSNDSTFSSYNVIASVTDGDGGIDSIITDNTTSGQYLRLYGTERTTGYGYSIWEMEINGSENAINNAPISNAGKDQIILPSTETVTLNGSGTDIDGTITSYFWEALDGGIIQTPDSANTIVSGLTNGTYTFLLTVTDNLGASSSDEVIITVSETANDCHSISLDKIYSASSSINSTTPAMAFDGDSITRWESEYDDPQWIAINLQDSYHICSLVIDWETAAGKTYEIQLSNDSTFATYNIIASITDGDGGIDSISTDNSMSGQYLRLYGTERTTGYGYSIWEMDVLGSLQPASDDTEAPEAPAQLGASPAQYACFLSWTAATDNVGVTEYRVYKGNSLEATVDAPNTTMTISGLVPETEYTFSVYAVDAAGNISEPASITTTTESLVVDTSALYGISNIAISMPTYESSVNTEGVNDASSAVDGNLTTRWESAYTDDEWMTVDLGLRYYIGRVILYWEAASGKHYNIQVSDDNENWTTIAEFNPDTTLEIEPRTDDITTTTATGRYVRMQGIERNSPWGWSLFEFEIYSPGSGPEDIPDPNPNPNPDPVPPSPSSFGINSPIDSVVITDTRRPTLSWNSVDGATSYQVWVNITKTDYDWYKWGSLLDRFTKVGEVTGTEFTLDQDLSDRWTYKWYIAAIEESDTEYSDVGIFSVYIPELEQYDDGVSIINNCRDLNKDGSIQPYEDWTHPISVRVSDLLSRMTLEEKAYQMFYNAQEYPMSGWAFGPGTVDDMFNKQKTSAATRLGIPFVSAGDCIHGYGTTYPVQSALAASRNLEITRQCGDMHRVEQKAVGMRGSLSPLAEVGTKVLYPRIQEGCGEDAEFASAMVRAMVCGMQGGPELNPNSVMVTTKHWPGEGAGGESLIVYDAVTIKYHMKPWFANVDAGAGSVMPGYAGSSFIDPGGSGAGDSKPILDYLRDVVNFEGVICTDWLPYGSWVNSALAGADVMGGSNPGAEGFSMDEFIESVGEERINEACERILQAKFRLGVFEDPYGDPEEGPNTWFTEEHQNIAIDAARQSMTLLENDGVLPLNLASGEQLLVTGSRADDGESQSIWTSYFHASAGAKTMFEAISEKATEKGITTYLDEAPNPSAAVVIIGEPTYTHGTSWDKEEPYIHDAYFEISDTYEYDLSTLEEVDAMGIPYVVVVIMPRPYILADVKEMTDALLIAYRPGDGGGPALAQILFGEYEPQGKLPWQLPRSMDQIGTDVISGQIEKWDLPFDLDATPAERQEIRTKIAQNEEILPIYGDPLYQYGDGIQGYDNSLKSTSLVSDNMKENKSQFMLYPNPMNDLLNFKTENANITNCEISIKDLSGNTLIQKSVNTTGKINVSELSSGAYIVTFTHPDFSESKMIIKK